MEASGAKGAMLTVEDEEALLEHSFVLVGQGRAQSPGIEHLKPSKPRHTLNPLPHVRPELCPPLGSLTLC